MAATSTYISLSSSVLLEYEYRDQSSTVNEFTCGIGTGGEAPWFLMQDGHDNSVLLFNNDHSIPVTGNVRTRMGAPTDVTTSQYGLLKLNQITALNDYDPLLTDTVNLPVSFSAVHNVSYDVVRLHLVQGFNYENTEGMYFRLGFENNNGTIIRHLNLAYRKSDNYAQINPNPFMLGGKYYASYIEIKVPAVYNLIEEFRDAVYAGSPTVDLPSSRLTEGVGPKYDTMITTEFGWMVNEKTINGQSYFYTYELKRVDLPVLDQFNDLSAVVQASTAGDYIELYAAFNGVIIDNFITSLNNSGNDYIILHELGVYEYVWSTGTLPTWVKTSTLEFVQDSDYSEPILYRPVIQNPSASSYRIDYTVRLYNRDDSSSIWKSGSAQFNDALKYAKNLQKINLGSNPIQPKVYNKIFEKNVALYGDQAGSNLAAGSTANYLAWHTAYQTLNNITVNSMNAYLVANPETQEYELKTVGNSQTQTVYAQGLGRFILTKSDTYVKFVMYEGVNPGQKLNLTNLGDLYINFFADSGETKSFINHDPSKVSPGEGEVLFKIPAKDSKIISSYSDKSFTITNKSGEGISQMYVGEFIIPSKQVGTMKDRKIENLQKQIDESNAKYQSLQTLYANDQTTIKGLEETIGEQVDTINSKNEALGQALIDKTTALAAGDLSEEEIVILQSEITAMEILAQAAEANLASTLASVDAECPSCDNEYNIGIAVNDSQGNVSTMPVGS